MPDPVDTIEGIISGSTVSGWDVALAIAVVLAGWVASIYVRRAILALLGRWRGISEELRALIARLVKYAVILMAVGIALGFLGASVQPLLTAAIIVAVIVVLALRGIADNFAAGVVLQTRRPIKVGDEIEVGEYIGVVRELNGRAVVIRTLDGRTIHVPNVQLLQSPVVNHSEAGARRSDVWVRVSLGGGGSGGGGVDARPDGRPDARPLLERAAHDAEGVHTREATRVYLVESSPGRATYLVRFWHHPAHRRPVTSAVIEALDAAARSAGIDAVIQSRQPDPPLTPPERF